LAYDGNLPVNVIPSHRRDCPGRLLVILVGFRRRLFRIFVGFRCIQQKVRQCACLAGVSGLYPIDDLHEIYVSPNKNLSLAALIITAAGITAAGIGLYQSGKGNSWIGNIHAEIVDNITEPVKEGPMQDPAKSGQALDTGISNNPEVLRGRIFNRINQKNTEELRLIVEKADLTEWSDLALEAASEILEKRTANVSYYHEKFRIGDPMTRERAALELENLGEVEKF